MFISNENVHASVLYTPNLSNSNTLKKQLDPLLLDIKKYSILPFSPSILQKTIQNTHIKAIAKPSKFTEYEKLIK